MYNLHKKYITMVNILLFILDLIYLLTFNYIFSFPLPAKNHTHKRMLIFTVLWYNTFGIVCTCHCLYKQHVKIQVTCC